MSRSIAVPNSYEFAAAVPMKAAGLLDEGYAFALVSTTPNLDRLDRQPFGVKVAAYDFSVGSGEDWNLTRMLQMYLVMNGLAFGSRGIPMPNWVLVDHALKSAGMMLVTLPRDRLAELANHRDEPLHHREPLLTLLKEADRRRYDGPIPVAGYCAAPTPIPGHWTGWSLCSVVNGHGVGTLVKALALRAYGASSLGGITQYDNPALRIHTRFGPTTITAGLLPLHTTPHSFSYQTDLTAFQSPTRRPSPPIEATPFLLDARDVSRQILIQRAIGRGGQFTLLPPASVTVGNRQMVRVAEHRGIGRGGLSG